MPKENIRLSSLSLIWTFLRRFSVLEWYLSLASMSLLIWHISIYLSPYISTNRLHHIAFFIIIALLTYVRPMTGFTIAVFSLPFLTGFTTHLGSWIGHPIPKLELWALDVGCGLILGLWLRFLGEKWHANRDLDHLMPKVWLYSFGAIQLYLIVSAIISISRNLHQTSTSWTLKGLTFNLFQVRTLDWHDDFFPLQDLVIFLTACLLLPFLIRLFRQEKIKDPFHAVTGLVYANMPIVFYALIQKIFSVGYFQSEERGVNSFFPDIHAFGGFELICLAICLTGIILKKGPRWLYLNGFMLSWLGLILSGSRFAVVAAPILCILIFLSLSTYVSKRVVLRSLFMTLFIAIIGGGFFYQSRSGQHLVQTLSWDQLTSGDFRSINRMLSYRPEQWIAAASMHREYPFMGLGLAAFNRSSSIEGFSSSRYFLSNHGENAHNYFIQILVEIGWVGIFVLLIPFFLLKTPALEKRIIIGFLLAIAFGNLYGHELLLREFVLMLVVILGFLFAVSEDVDRTQQVRALWLRRKLNVATLTTIGMLLLTSIVAIREVYGSFDKEPFSYARLCQQAGFQLAHDNWVPIRYEHRIRAAHQKIEFSLHVNHPDLAIKPVTIRYGQVNSTNNIPASSITISDHHTHKIQFSSEQRLRRGATYYFEADRCFVPQSWGLGYDRRRLAINLSEIKIDPQVDKVTN